VTRKRISLAATGCRDGCGQLRHINEGVREVLLQ
jgi:hypothetical protein